MLALQAQRSELQSLFRLTESTEEGQGQGLPSASFRALVLDRAIPQALADYALAKFTIDTQAQTDSPTQFDTHTQAATESQAESPAEAQPGTDVKDSAGQIQQAVGNLDRQAEQSQKVAGDAHGQKGVLCKRGSEEWGRAIAMAGLPWALQLLAAIARGHQVSQPMRKLVR